MRRALPGTLSLALILIGIAALGVRSQPDVPFVQSPEQVYNEMLVVYYGNLARQENGAPPLGYCGHLDTLGRWPSERVPLFGYNAVCGAENCYCGYMLPEDAITGWMNSPGHRANLLDPNSREIGMGYYRAADGRGYLTQDFGHDAVYPPVVIDLEAVNTVDPTVDLYIYDREDGGGFAGMGPAVEMQVANEPCFEGISWEPYRAQRSWNLESGEGWRMVYVKTRDAVGRTTVATDTIYLGATVPLDELGLHLASSHAEQVTLYDLDPSWPEVQLSQSWFVDDQFETFEPLWGEGQRINDPEARGGTAFQLSSAAWVWTTEFFRDVPLIAYVRLKVSDNTEGGQVARFWIQGGGTEYGPLSISGTAFASPGVYQEFPLAFTFHENADDPFLILHFSRTGSADVTVDGVSIFTAPQPIRSPLTWAVPGGNYRGGGVWVRYVDGADFSPIQEAQPSPSRIEVSPPALAILVQAGETPPVELVRVARRGCTAFAWDAQSDAAWLDVLPVDDTVEVRVDTSGLGVGTHRASITVATTPVVSGSPVQVPVEVTVADALYRAHLPIVLRDQTSSR